MDFCRDISVSGGLHSDYHQPEQQLVSPSCSKIDGSLDDLFSGHPLEEGDVNLEWLSIFVEDCLSSSGSVNFPPPAATSPTPQITTCDTTNSVASQLVKDSTASHLLQQHKIVIPGKARSKRKRSHSNCVPGGTSFMSRRRGSCWSQAHQFFMNPPHAQELTLTSDPPLLQQAYWLADSELIFPKKEEEEEEKDHPTNYTSSGSRKEFRGDGDDLQEVVVNKQLGRKKKRKKVNHNCKLMMVGVEGRKEEVVEENNNSGGIRRCSHCLSQRTPQWRGGPLGPKTLCNACGVRYKSGRLLPEYRPAKSPTFVSYMHSNSHKKVLEMRTLSHSL